LCEQASKITFLSHLAKGGAHASISPRGDDQGGLRAPTGKITIKPQCFEESLSSARRVSKGFNDSPQSRAVKPKILSNQKEQMAYLFELTSTVLTGPSRNCYNEPVLLHNNLFIPYPEPLSEWRQFLHSRQTKYLEAGDE
jgi:hypothetical protein